MSRDIDRDIGRDIDRDLSRHHEPGPAEHGDRPSGHRGPMAERAHALHADVLLRALSHELVPLLAAQRGALRRLVPGSGSGSGSGSGVPSGSADAALALALADDVASVLGLLGGLASPAEDRHAGRAFAAVGSDLCRRHPGVRVRTGPAAARCAVDGVRLSTVLDNLVRNEAEHAGSFPQVQGVVRRRRLLVDVQHRGPVPVRLAAALRAQAGEPTPGHRGFGLWLVRCLVAQMGGSTGLAPGPDGWAVRVTLPLHHGVARPPQPVGGRPPVRSGPEQGDR